MDVHWIYDRVQKQNSPNPTFAVITSDWKVKYLLSLSFHVKLFIGQSEISVAVIGRPYVHLVHWH